MNGQWRKATRTRVIASGAVMALAAGAVSVGGGSDSADAAGPVPSFPDNIVVFPNRDMVSVEGYSELGGQTALVEVVRPGVGIVGSAEVLMSGGDVAFEINHPGGYCWGANTDLQVTPDILPGDQVTMRIGGTEIGTTTVLDAQAFDGILQPDGVTVVIPGHIGAGVDPAQIEQRIVEPALRDTSVGRRDVRALLGGLAPGRDNYESSLEVNGTDLTATYIFSGPDAAVAAELTANVFGERVLAWQVTDPLGNRQGLTIAENNEPGGPGMGGCPAGPGQSGPPAPQNIVASRPAGSDTATITWTPATALPGTPAIDGYEVTAIDTNPSGTEYDTIGKRIADPAADGTTITGLHPSRTYDFEIVSVSTVGKTFPAATASQEQDITAPVVLPSIPAGSYPVPQLLELVAQENGVDIYYTLDGSDPVSGGLTTATALPYTGPIPISGTTTVKFAAFDLAGNVSDIETLTFTITNDPVAAQTSILSGTPALNAVDLSWAAADPVAPATAITGYLVRVYDAEDALATFNEVNTAGDVLATTVNGLVGNTPYWFTVAAKNDVNSAWGPESDRFGPVTAQGSIVADAGPDQGNVVRGTAAQLNGDGSTDGGVTYQWTQMTDAVGSAVMPAGPDRVTIANAAAQSTTFTMPLYNATMSLAPLHFRLTVSDGVSAPISDMVTITPRNDTVGITTARWKAGDFRVVGAGAIDGATITVWATVNGVTNAVGTAQVTAGGWQVRLRNNAPAVAPTAVWAVSNQGAYVGPVVPTV